MDYKLSPIGKSDKPPSGMFVINHFNKTKENIGYIQPSIMQHQITFTGEFYHQLDSALCKIQVWGMQFFKSSHVMLLICLGHPCLYDVLNLLNQSCSFGSPYIFLLELISLFFHLPCSVISMLQNTFEHNLWIKTYLYKIWLYRQGMLGHHLQKQIKV